MASLAVQAEVSTVHIADALSKRVSEVAADTEAKTSRTVGTIAQQLEREIEAAAVSTSTTSEQRTRSAVDGLRESKSRLKFLRIERILSVAKRKRHRQLQKSQLTWSC